MTDADLIKAARTAALNAGVFSDPGMDPSEQSALIEAISSLRQTAGDF